MPQTDAVKAISAGSEGAGDGAKWLFLVALIFNYSLSGGMNYFVGMVRALQMLVHVPMLQAVIPGNVLGLFEYFIPIAMFDILDNDYGLGYELFLDFDDDTQEELSEDIIDQT